jgi:1,4-dihydroxy-2-naphthoate octaprenyltransferase
MKIAKQYFLATRPTFLTITLFACLIGFLGSNPQNHKLVINALALIMVLLAHASSNVLNDYFDHLNGSDFINSNRISPFTGGSRYIQNNILSPKQIYALGIILLAASVILGLYLCYLSTWQLAPIGFIGIVIGWSYSAPPLQLMSRGALGEVAIALAWSLIVIGFSLLQSNPINASIILIGIAYGLMVANILFLNQFPDRGADKSVGKNTLAAKTDPRKLWKWYLLFFIAAYILQLLAIIYGTSLTTAITLLATPVFCYCVLKIKNFPLDRLVLIKTIPLNIMGVHLYALLLCIGLYWSQQI